MTSFSLSLVYSKAERFINCVRFSPDGERYAVGSSDKLVQLYDGKTGDRIGQLPVEHEGSIFSLAWTGNIFFSSFFRSRIYVIFVFLI